MSDAVERRLLDLLERPRQSPFGNVIPGLADLDPAVADAELPAGRSLAAVAGEEPSRVTVQRIAEVLQADEATMAELRRVGAMPGRDVWAVRRGTGVHIGDEVAGLALGPTAAAQVIVAVA